MSDEGKLLESLVDYLSDGQKHVLRIFSLAKLEGALG